MITVVLWKWRSSGNWKRYTAGHVNAIVAMVDAYLDLPCQFVLITDDADGVDRGVRCLPLERAAAALPQIRTPQRNAYRRVGLFDPRMADVLGKRLLQLDLDTVITSGITALVDRSEPFLIWKSPSIGPKGYALNPSFLLLTAGARADIHTGYCADSERVALAAAAAGWTGTDQAVIAHLTGGAVALVGEDDGILSFRDHLQGGAVQPPRKARIVSFMDRFDPADPALQDRHPWIAHHYPYRRQRLAA